MARRPARGVRSRYMRSALVLLLFTTAVLPAADYPTAEISNDVIQARFYVPDVETQQGVPVAEEMLGRSLVRPYDGGRRAGWCG